MADSRRLFLIGIDAGDQSFIRENLSHLPNMALFFRGAAVNPLEAEPMSGSVWGSFATRLRPGDHGLYHHLQWNPARMRIERSHPRWIGEMVPFWRDLTRRGRGVTALDVPFVFPGRNHAALEISNWGSHDLVGPFWCSDPAEERGIRARYGAHPMGFEIPLEKHPQELARIFVRDFVVARDIAGGLSWPSTRAFSLDGDLAGYWRFNLMGREAGGVVSDEAAEALRGLLSEAFSRFTMPDGRPLVRRIHFPARDTPGARAQLLPDVLAEWDPDVPPAVEARHPELGAIRGHIVTGRGGNHRFNGFYAHRGPRSGQGPKPRHISELGDLAEALVA